MEIIFLTKATQVINVEFSPCPYSPIFKTMPMYAGNPISGSSPIPQVTFSGWVAQIVMTTAYGGTLAYQFSANLYPTSYAGRMTQFNARDTYYCNFISSQPLHDGFGLIPTVQFNSGGLTSIWSVNILAPIAPGDYIGAVSKSGLIDPKAYGGTTVSIGQAYPISFLVPEVGVCVFCDGFAVTGSTNNWGGVLVQTDLSLFWTSNNGHNAVGGYDLNYSPPQAQRNWTDYIPCPVNGGICKFTNYPALTGDPSNRMAFLFSNAGLIENIDLFRAPDSQFSRIWLNIADEVAFVWPEIESCPFNTWRVCYTQFGALIYGANDGSNDLNFYQRNANARVYYVDFPSRTIYPVRMTTTDNVIFAIANDPSVVPGTPDSLFTEFVWGRDGLYYVSNYGLWKDAAAQPNAGYSVDPNGGAGAITVARANFVPPPRPIKTIYPRGVGYYTHIDPRSYIDSDKPK